MKSLLLLKLGVDLAPRILGQVLLPLAAKGVGLDPPGRHLTPNSMKNQLFSHDSNNLYTMLINI